MIESNGTSLPPLPQPTKGERIYHESVVDSGKYSFHQERVDAMRLARIGIITNDLFTQQIALLRWNRTYNEPFEQYSSASLLVAVEESENTYET